MGLVGVCCCEIDRSVRYRYDRHRPMSSRYLIRLSPPSPKVQQQRPRRDLLSPGDSGRRAPSADDELSSIVEYRSGHWTLQLVGCQERDAVSSTASGATATLGLFQQQERAGSSCSSGIPSERGTDYWIVGRRGSGYWADRLFIQSVKWFTLARCLFRLIGNVPSIACPVDGRFLAYPSEAHSQTRLMVAACVTARVLANHWPTDCWPTVRLALTPTPRLELPLSD